MPWERERENETKLEQWENKRVVFVSILVEVSSLFIVCLIEQQLSLSHSIMFLEKYNYFSQLLLIIFNIFVSSKKSELLLLI